MTNSIMRRTALVLGGAAVAVTLTGCGTPLAVGTVIAKPVEAAHTEPGACSGDGVTTPLICDGDSRVPAAYFLRVKRRDARFVLVAVDRRTYRRVPVGAHFDERTLKYLPETWQSYQYEPGKWAE